MERQGRQNVGGRLSTLRQQKQTPDERAQLLKRLIEELPMTNQLLQTFENVPHHDEESVQAILRGDIPEFATEPVPGEMPVSKPVLVQRCAGRWETVAKDLVEASRNGLSIAKADSRGWYERLAVAWAVRNGRVVDKSQSVWFPEAGT